MISFVHEILCEMRELSTFIHQQYVNKTKYGIKTIWYERFERKIMIPNLCQFMIETSSRNNLLSKVESRIRCATSRVKIFHCGLQYKLHAAMIGYLHICPSCVLTLQNVSDFFYVFLAARSQNSCYKNLWKHKKQN